MPDSISHESMREWISCSVFLFVCLFVFSYLFFCLLWGDTSVFLRMKEMESVLSL